MEATQPHILIIEDEGAILRGISQKFELEGFRVSTAQDGVSGLASAMEGHPDVILLDYLLPGMDGFAVLEKLRQDGWGKTAKVILWSNSHSKENVERGTQLGTLEYLVKSDWEYKDIVRKVREHLASGSQA